MQNSKRIIAEVDTCVTSAYISALSPLCANPARWSNTLKQFVGNDQRIVRVCLTILWLTLEGLTYNEMVFFSLKSVGQQQRQLAVRVCSMCYTVRSGVGVLAKDYRLAINEVISKFQPAFLKKF